jgi:hypothetical protein
MRQPASSSSKRPAAWTSDLCHSVMSAQLHGPLFLPMSRQVILACEEGLTLGGKVGDGGWVGG